MFDKRLQVFIRSAPTSGSVGPEADATDTFYTNWNLEKAQLDEPASVGEL